jgi:hypothetical protein
MSTIPDGPPMRQPDLFPAFGSPSHATRCEAMKAKRLPLLETMLAELRRCGRHGATRYELASALERPIQSICRPALDLLAAVLVAAEFYDAFASAEGQR